MTERATNRPLQSVAQDATADVVRASLHAAFDRFLLRWAEYGGHCYHGRGREVRQRTPRVKSASPPGALPDGRTRRRHWGDVQGQAGHYNHELACRSFRRRASPRTADNFGKLLPRRVRQLELQDQGQKSAAFGFRSSFGKPRVGLLLAQGKTPRGRARRLAVVTRTLSVHDCGRCLSKLSSAGDGPEARSARR
jgi:hypothetical protein